MKELASGSTAIPHEVLATITAGDDKPTVIDTPPITEKPMDLRGHDLRPAPPVVPATERAEGTPSREHSASALPLTQSDDNVARPASGLAAMLRQPKVALALGGVVLLVALVGTVMAMRGGGDDDRKQRAHHGGDSANSGDQIAGVNDPRRPGAQASGSQMHLDEAPKKSGFGDTASAMHDDPNAGSASEPSPEPSPTDGSAAGSASGSAAGSAGSAATPVAPKKPATLGGKKVVLEYDNQKAAPAPKKTAAAPAADDASIAAARMTYFDGNRKLFAGDADAAIRLYRQALGMYPGYVAGYRGLVLAYAQKGDKPNALKAFRTYMTAVPTAKDIPIIKKRLAAMK